MPRPHIGASHVVRVRWFDLARGLGRLATDDIPVSFRVPFLQGSRAASFRSVPLLPSGCNSPTPAAPSILFLSFGLSSRIIAGAVAPMVLQGRAAAGPTAGPYSLRGRDAPSHYGACALLASRDDVVTFKVWGISVGFSAT